MTGELYPRYKVGPMCSHPTCSRFVDDVHHVVRRSFIGGDIAWVKFGGDAIVGNLAGLCNAHHRDITENRSQILYEPRYRHYSWVDLETGENLGTLYPHPPVHGKPDEISEPLRAAIEGDLSILGPAARETCEGCGRLLPHKEPADHDRKKERTKRRKTWTVRVPDEAEEDGALVLDTLVEEVAAVFGRETGENLRYYVIAQALALVIQNGHLLG